MPKKNGGGTCNERSHRSNRRHYSKIQKFTPQLTLSTKTIKTFEFTIQKTTDAIAYNNGVRGQMALEFEPSQIDGFSDLAQSWDQLRIDAVRIQFHYCANPTEPSGGYAAPMTGLFVYDPDGYTVTSGPLTEHGTGITFPLSRERSSRKIAVEPACRVENMVKTKQFFDMAGTIPTHFIGGLLLFAPEPQTVEQLSIMISWEFEFTVKGTR